MDDVRVLLCCLHTIFYHQTILIQTKTRVAHGTTLLGRSRNPNGSLWLTALQGIQFTANPPNNLKKLHWRSPIVPPYGTPRIGPFSSHFGDLGGPLPKIHFLKMPSWASQPLSLVPQTSAWPVQLCLQPSHMASHLTGTRSSGRDLHWDYLRGVRMSHLTEDNEGYLRNG